MPAFCSTTAKIFRHPKSKGTFQKPQLRFRKNSNQKQPANSAGGFDFPTQLVGQSKDSRVSVYVDPATGSAGQQNAADLLSWAQGILTWHDALFGYQGGAHNIIIAAVNGATDGTGGAYHYGCDFSSGGDLYLDAASGNSALVAGLYAAELSEAFMGPNATLGQTQPNPWGCGYSTGEGLSRVCANETCALVGSPGAMEAAGFGAASSWNTADDWITKTEQTDQDYDSTGATMVAIDWLRSNGMPLYTIARAPADTMQMVYASLNGQGQLYPVLVSAVQGLAGGVTSDYPFTGGPNPSGAIPGGGSPPPPPPPPPPPQPGTEALNATGTMTVFGQQFPIVLSGTVGAAHAARRAVDWWAVMADVGAIVKAAAVQDWLGVAADVTQLLADLGITLPPAEFEKLRAAMIAHWQTMVITDGKPIQS